ncbi:hypothetical protein FRX31_013274 [Thalictrum thalictroides]|uniref:Uncharacterized protein n=1 Tax=Thalictrum thalictroides TaxID=46969 RepID=A0A7J6WIE7_THATH|nr:hypothetical protein FRX31_013274 [Thalictrum thalictroides]
MSESATDSQNVSVRDDTYEGSDVSMSSENEMDNSVDISEVREKNVVDRNNEDEVDSCLHVSPEQARKAFQSIRNLYRIEVPELEMYKVDSRFYDLAEPEVTIAMAPPKKNTAENVEQCPK